MSKATEHPEAVGLEDAAWDLKSLAEQFHSRAMTAETRAVLASARRDVERIKRSVEAEWSRRCSVRKRDKDEPAAPPAATGAHQQPLLGDDARLEDELSSLAEEGRHG